MLKKPLSFILRHEDEQRGQFVAFGFISSTDRDMLAYVNWASTGSVITLDNGSSFHARHVEVRGQNIGIALQTESLQTISAWKSFDNVITFYAHVSFKLKYYYFRGLHNNIAALPHAIVRKLIPTPRMLKSSIRLYNSLGKSTIDPPRYKFLNLDARQLRELHSILNAPPTILFVEWASNIRLLARAAYEILKKKDRKVLICTYHQSTADSLMNYFGRMKENRNLPWSHDVLRVIPHSSYAQRKSYKDYYTEKWNISDICNCSLIITTLGTAPSMMRLGKMNGYFTDILIYEGAQAIETETIGPLCYANESTRIVIAGNHSQVRKHDYHVLP